MNYDRRRFIAGAVVGSAELVAPSTPALALSRSKPRLLRRAMAALDAHSRHIWHRDLLGLVDFSRRSGLPRFDIVDVASGRTVSSHLVAHGRGSDPGNTGVVHKFSNRHGSNASCQGSFVTGPGYVGKHGRSRRLLGLEPQNNNAASRAIVIHSADYVSPGMARLQGRVGRSLGCFAVTDSDIRSVLGLLGEGRLLYAAK